MEQYKELLGNKKPFKIKVPEWFKDLAAGTLFIICAFLATSVIGLLIYLCSKYIIARLILIPIPLLLFAKVIGTVMRHDFR